ncbi:MAG: biofilm PGA synthesis protein PgaB [Verrucomicrobiae bacterium]|nr:biofilm PGA synthesis protein PgaB [Verrucomicrobiae bacterium]
MKTFVRFVFLSSLLATPLSRAEEPAADVSAPLRVAIYRGPGVGGAGPEAVKKRLDAEPGRFTASFVGPEDVRAGLLFAHDAVIFPGGSGSRQADGLGADGREDVRSFVRTGGTYLGICAGCYLACENFSWSLKILDAKTKSSKWQRGTKMLELGFTPEASSLLGVPEAGAKVKYVNGPVMEAAGSQELPDFTPLALFRTEVAENGTPAGIQVDSPAILAGTFGKGRVVGISPHPEQSEGLGEIVPRLLDWAAGRIGSARDMDAKEATGSGR